MNQSTRVIAIAATLAVAAAPAILSGQTSASAPVLKCAGAVDRKAPAPSSYIDAKLMAAIASAEKAVPEGKYAMFAVAIDAAGTERVYSGSSIIAAR